MIPIAIGVAAVALLLIILSRMDAENTGPVTPDNVVICGGGDPAIIHLTADAAITPGDNVEPGGSAARVKACDNSAEEFIGTADVNSKGGELAGTEPISTDYAQGDVVAVITGDATVRKIAEGGISSGKIVRPGTTAGTSCLADATSTAKYIIGRNVGPDIGDGEAFRMRHI